MCNRFSLPVGDRDISFEWDVKVSAGYSSRSEIFPTNEILVIKKEKDQLATEMRRWGLVGSWVQPHQLEQSMKDYLNTNAKAETIFQLKSFKVPAKEKRCLIPASGFFEFTGEKGHKIKNLITLKDRKLFAFAGLYENWVDKSGEKSPVQTCTIITCAPGEWMMQYHHREPVIVPKDLEDMWLDLETPQEVLYKEILKASSEEMQAVTA